MTKITLKFVVLSLILLSQLSLYGKNESYKLPTDSADTWQVSLITCGPGVEVYNQFGHSAIRMKNDKMGIDAIYNYGIDFACQCICKSRFARCGWSNNDKIVSCHTTIIIVKTRKFK